MDEPLLLVVWIIRRDRRDNLQTWGDQSGRTATFPSAVNWLGSGVKSQPLCRAGEAGRAGRDAQGERQTKFKKGVVAEEERTVFLFSFLFTTPLRSRQRVRKSRERKGHRYSR